MSIDLHELKTWLSTFLAADLAATESDSTAPRAPFCADSVSEDFAKLPRPEAPLIERVLFKLVAPRCLEESQWVGAIVSEATSSRRGRGKYHLMLILDLKGATPSVCGVYDVCTACVALGTDGQGDTCIECSGLGWEHWFGVDLGRDWGPMVALEHLKRPSTPLYLPAWKRGKDARRGST